MSRLKNNEMACRIDFNVSCKFQSFKVTTIDFIYSDREVIKSEKNVQNCHTSPISESLSACPSSVFDVMLHSYVVKFII